MSNSDIKIIKRALCIFAFAFTVCWGFSIIIVLNSGIEVNVTEIPKGESDKKVGQVITASQSKSIKDNGVKINFPQLNSEQNGSNTQQKSKNTTIVAATFGDKIRLIDFFVTDINQKPELSFKSTARGMVFINPLFAGLPFEKRVNIFQSIEKDSKFQDLVKAVANSSSLLDEQVINLSTDIAIKIAKDNNLFIGQNKTSYLPYQSIFNSTKNTNFYDYKKENNPLQILSNLFMPAVQAQSNEPKKLRIESTLTQQFSNDKLFFDQISVDYPIWHGMKLDASGSVVKITGTSPLAQQVIVVPKDKLKTKNIENDDYDGAKKLDADVVAEALLEPADLGIWDGSLVTTATGNNQIEKVITPRNGGDWQPGEYGVLISAGLNRTGEGQTFGALTLNAASYIIDTLTLVIGNGEKNTKTDNVLKVAQLLGDCGKNLSLYAKDFNSTIDTLNSCITNPEQLTKIGEVLDLPVGEEAIKTTFKLFKFEGEVWGKLAKRVVKVIDLTDKGIAISRIFLLGQYLNRENTEGLYKGEFSVIEKPYAIISDKLDSAEVTIDCSGKEPQTKYQALDVIIEITCFGQPDSGISSFTVINYSKNAVEFNLDVSNYLPELLYPDETIENNTDNFKIDDKKHGRIRPRFSSVFSDKPIRLTVSLKSYSPYNIAHEFTIACGTNTKIWGLQIDTQCVPPGLRATYRNTTKHNISLGFAGSSDPPIELKPIQGWLGGGGNLQSSSTQVTLSLISNP